MSYMYAAPCDGIDWTPRPDFPRVERLRQTIAVFGEQSRPKPASEMEAEALAMADCARALASLKSESRKRVVEWLRKQAEGEAANG